ncbi:MAG: magnesium protoporphyrin IX methyltransferase, partial [Stellaceae bacterium]
LDPVLGRFDHIVAMDSLIHYPAPYLVAMVAALSSRSDGSLLFTVAPRTAALMLMHAVGQLFPRRNRAPAIEPIDDAALRRRLAAEPRLAGWRPAQTRRVARGFYISQALELRG